MYIRGANFIVNIMFGLVPISILITQFGFSLTNIASLISFLGIIGISIFMIDYKFNLRMITSNYQATVIYIFSAPMFYTFFSVLR